MAKPKKGKDAKGAKNDKKANKKGKGKKTPEMPAKDAKPTVVEVETPSQPEVKKYDPCRFSPESCSEELGCRPNAYPGLLEFPVPMAIVGSESGKYESLCKLLNGGFRCTDRVLMMTPWGNYVLFKVKGQTRTAFFVFDGCTCNVNRFRYYDLNIGTAGLLFFKSTHEILQYIMNSKLRREHYNRLRKSVIDDICQEYASEFNGKQIRKIC